MRDKMKEWHRRRETIEGEREAFTKLQPFIHRCDRCAARDVSGIVCPDCLLRRSVVFLEVYGVTPDTRPYSIPRSQPDPRRSFHKGVPLPGYPDSNRYGRRPL